jgi:hypothetical protein
MVLVGPPSFLVVLHKVLLAHSPNTNTAFLYLHLVTFGNFWLTIQNTTNRHVSNAFDLLGVFISFPLARAAAAVAAADFCCCCCAHRPNPAPF